MEQVLKIDKVEIMEIRQVLQKHLIRFPLM